LGDINGAIHLLEVDKGDELKNVLFAGRYAGWVISCGSEAEETKQN
jgi:hypothetical protein